MEPEITPKVSVLIPFYNAEKYIERCARSIFEQTYDNLECIFVDDGSTDRTITVLEHTIEQYSQRENAVKIVRHETNRGIAAARNTAVENATGEFVSYVDSDDYLTNNAIEKLVTKQVETGADIVTGQVLRITKNFSVLMDRPHFQSKDDFVSDMANISFHHTLWGRLIRKSLYIDNHIRAEEGVNVGEDMYVMVQLAYYAQNIESLWDVVYYYDTTNLQSYMNIYEKDNIKKIKSDIESLKIVHNFLIGKNQKCIQRVDEILYSRYQTLLGLFGKDITREDFNNINKSIVLLRGKSSVTTFKGKIKSNFYIYKTIMRFGK